MTASDVITATANAQLEEIYNNQIVPEWESSKDLAAAGSFINALFAKHAPNTTIFELDEAVSELEGIALHDGFMGGFRYAVVLLAGSIGGRKDG